MRPFQGRGAALRVEWGHWRAGIGVRMYRQIVCVHDGPNTDRIISVSLITTAIPVHPPPHTLDVAKKKNVWSSCQ